MNERRGLWDRLVDRIIFGPAGRKAPRVRIMLSQDEYARRLRAWRESADGQEIEDLLIAAAVDEAPERAAELARLDPEAPLPQQVPERTSSYMVANVEFDKEIVTVEFAIPIPVATELIGHANSRDEYEEAQELLNEFVDRICDVIARALFGPLQGEPPEPRPWA